jgi:lysophospholipase L1-like esterase
LWLFNINLTYNEVKNGKYYSERTVEVNNWYKTYPPADSVFLDRMPEFVHLSVSYPNGLIDQPQFNNLSHKIIAMGDSFTEGVGAESPEKAWPKQLQKMIREQYDRDGYVMNAGIAGSDPIFCFRLFHDKLVHLKPSIVLLCINESDFRDVAIKGGVERFLPNGNVQYRTTSCLELVYATSYISRLPIKIFTGYDNFFVNNRDYGFAVNAIAACIDSFQHLAKQHHFELVTLFVPTEAELKVPNTNMSQLNHILLAKGYSCLNVRDELIYAINQKNLTASDLYWKEDRHLNSKGYEVLAKIIFDYLRKRAYL